MCGIMRAKLFHQFIEPCVIELLLLCGKGALDHDASALAHKTAQRSPVGGFQAGNGKAMVETVQKVGAVSTNVPSRSKTMMGFWLTGDIAFLSGMKNDN